MAGYKADEVVEKLEWDFTPFVPDAKGVVPEPSTEQVGAFFEQLHLIFDRPAGETDDKVVDYMRRMSEDQMSLGDDKLLAAHADLCGNSPNVDQLRALPHRQRYAFFGWITGQVTDPT
jgi:hypothetical protein